MNEALEGAGGIPPLGTESRATAHAFVEAVRRSEPSLLDFQGVDLGPALEQRLFFDLRRRTLHYVLPRSSGVSLAARSVARIAWSVPHAAAGLRSWQPAAAGSHPAGAIVVIALHPIHEQILAPIATELRARGVRDLQLVRAGSVSGSPRPDAETIRRFVTPGSLAAVAAFATRVMARWPPATRALPQVSAGIRALAPGGLVTLALDAARAISLLESRRPDLVVAFDEIGTWARLLPAIARQRGIGTLDLPHAEAADPVAIAGADYDRFAVYGSRASGVLRRAGVPAERIVETGAPRFDALLTARGPRAVRPGVGPRRIVFAAQHLAGAMTPTVRSKTLAAAIAAAAAAAPAEFIVCPHPVERHDEWSMLLREIRPPAGVTLRIERGSGLRDALGGAWLLVTGWSNSVYEGLLMDVPAITVNATGGPDPMPFAAEGLSLGATDPASAAAAARRLLDEAERERVLQLALPNLKEHLGPLDGRASSRAADLIVSMLP